MSKGAGHRGPATQPDGCGVKTARPGCPGRADGAHAGKDRRRRGAAAGRRATSPCRFAPEGLRLVVDGLLDLLGGRRTSRRRQAAALLAEVGPSALSAPTSWAILHAARSETSSNSWKLSVISVASLSA